MVTRSGASSGVEESEKHSPLGISKTHNIAVSVSVVELQTMVLEDKAREGLY